MRQTRPDGSGRDKSVMAEMVCVGAVAGAHGVRGLVRLKSFTEEPDGIVTYGPLWDERGERRFVVTVTGQAKGQLLARIEGIADRDAAEALKGTRLYVPRDALPETDEDEYYFNDLIGLDADAADGIRFGTVRAVHEFGAGPLLEIALEAGGTAMVPFTKAAVPTVDLAGGRLVVEPPAGLLDEAERDDGE